MTFVVETAAARQAANANGTNSRRLIEAEVSLSPPITWQGRAQRNWSKLLPNELNRRTSAAASCKQLK